MIHQKAHDIISQGIDDVKRNGVKNKDLAYLIQNALQQGLGHGALVR